MPPPAHAREPMTEAMPEPSTKAVPEPTTKAVPEPTTKAVVEMVEALHDDNRRCETEEPGRPTPTPLVPTPVRREVGIRIGKGLGIGIARGIRGICRRGDLIDLRRQSGCGLGDPPAAIGLLAGLDNRLLRLPSDRHRDRVAAAGRLCSGRLRAGGLSCRGQGVGQRLTRPTCHGHCSCQGRDSAHLRLLAMVLKLAASDPQRA